VGQAKELASGPVEALLGATVLGAGYVIMSTRKEDEECEIVDEDTR
jgi:hypothetical protein